MSLVKRIVSGVMSLLFIASASFGMASAANYNVGFGSFTDTMPSGGTGPQSEIYKTANLKGSVPTSSWESSLLWVKFSEAIYAHPLSYKCAEKGIEVCNPPKTTAKQPDGDVDIVMEHREYGDFTVGHTNVGSFADAKADKITDWTATALMGNGASGIRATFVKGSPYSYFEYSGGNPKLIFQGVPAVFSGNAASQYLGITINGSNYGLFAPLGSTWSGLGTNTITLNLPSGKNYLSVALLSDNKPATLTYFKNYAYAFVTDTKVSWDYNESASTLNTTYTVTTTPKEGTNSDTIIGLYPHQWRNQREISFLPYTYSTIRGPMKTVLGTSFKTTYSYKGILPSLPDKGTYSKAELSSFVNEAYNDSRRVRGDGDTYWVGKDLGRIACVLPIAEQVGNTAAAESFKSSMKSAMESWFSADSKDGNLFYRDNNWGTLIGYPAGYGSNNELNDHHFHYGYFVFAAAQIAMRDPQWASDSRWGGMVNLLIKDMANPDHSDTSYPFLRNFDPYEGHSWASGHAKFYSGNNQESSSEAINAWQAIILWGESTGNKTLRDLGIYLYTTEVESVNNYWFNIYGDVFDPAYPSKDSSMIWGGKYVHTTWWTDNAEEVHGINILPVTAASLYLGTSPGYVKTKYDAMVRENGGEPTVWRDVLYSYYGLYNPSEALKKWSSSIIPEDGETKAHTYHWLHNLNGMGLPDFTVTADTPLYGVFSKNGTRTYVAYNAGTASKTVTFSDGKILNVSARSMAADSGSANTTPIPTPHETGVVTPTPVVTGDFSQSLVSIGEGKAKFVFTPVSKCSWVDVHYKVNSTGQLNYKMVQNNGVWEFEVANISRGDKLDYFFTYDKAGLAYDSQWFKASYENSESKLIYGDVSGDDTVDSADYTYMRKYLIGIINRMPAQNWKVIGDLNNDGTIDSADFTLLRRYLLGMMNKLPV